MRFRSLRGLDPGRLHSSLTAKQGLGNKGLCQGIVEKVQKPDAEQRLPQAEPAAWFNMSVPNEGFPHVLQGIIILLLMSMC